jgi:hypothetical protein
MTVDATIAYAKKHAARSFTLTVSELLVYLAICMLYGRTGRKVVKEMWSQNAMINFKYVSRLMSRDRFLDINRYLHLPAGDSETYGKPNRFKKISWFADEMRKRFKNNWKLSQVFNYF